MNYIRVCEFQTPPRYCHYVSAQDFLAENAGNTQLDTVLSNVVISNTDFWSYIGLVAVSWAVAHIIRQMLNLVNWRR